jgi:hypothetical protein
MVEKTDALLNKRDTQLLGRLENSLVILTTTWCRNVLGSGTSSSVNIIDEGELPMSVEFTDQFEQNRLTKASLETATSLNFPSHSSCRVVSMLLRKVSQISWDIKLTLSCSVNGCGTSSKNAS